MAGQRIEPWILAFQVRCITTEQSTFIIMFHLHLHLIQFINTFIILDLFQCHFWTMCDILKIVINKQDFYASLANYQNIFAIPLLIIKSISEMCMHV